MGERIVLPLLFEKIQFKLDFTKQSPENDVIRTRFLDFMIQSSLWDKPGLWQPASGQPFFTRKPRRVQDGIAQFQGFSARVVITTDERLGLCVGVKHKYVSQTPLPHTVSRNEFKRWKGQHCIYHYGYQWYQFQIESLADLNVSEHEVLYQGDWISLHECVMRKCRKPLPQEIANLPTDCSVVLYRNNRGDERSAPTKLCYQTFGTEERSSSKIHRLSILPPYTRYKLTCKFVSRYFHSLRFGNTQVRVSDIPIQVHYKVFQVPDLLFGNDKILSVRNTPSADFHVGIDQLGETRLALLQDDEVGFYEQESLAHQYWVIPQSVLDTYGGQFSDDLVEDIDLLFPQDGGYQKQIIPYDDCGVPRTFLKQANAIRKAIQSHRFNAGGYALVMLHHIRDKKLREEDKLESFAIRALRDYGIQATIIHTEVTGTSYQKARESDEVNHRPRQKTIGKLRGYLRNVALKVLLNNRRWPFVLATQLHADVTVGIDAKNNLVGFVVVGERGKEIYWIHKVSSQKKEVRKKEIKAFLLEILREEISNYTERPETLVIHWDGTVHRPHIEGIEDVLRELKIEGLVTGSATLTVVEISKSLPVSLRLFEVRDDSHQKWINNPMIGQYYIANETDGYLCATGEPFNRKGTVNPLHVRYVTGALPLEKCLEDILCLTLPWTRPEDCTRYPITIKLNDILLGAEASDYQEEELEVERVLNSKGVGI